jgi:hypothetical protein
VKQVLSGLGVADRLEGIKKLTCCQLLAFAADRDKARCGAGELVRGRHYGNPGSQETNQWACRQFSDPDSSCFRFLGFQIGFLLRRSKHLGAEPQADCATLRAPRDDAEITSKRPMKRGNIHEIAYKPEKPDRLQDARVVSLRCPSRAAKR